MGTLPGTTDPPREARLVPQRVLVPLNAAEPALQVADVLSYRNGPCPHNPLAVPGWLCGKAIAVAGRGDEVHTGLADRDTSGKWMALGMRLGRQKLKYLDDEVAASPGLIDVYRPIGRVEWTGLYPFNAPGLPWHVRRKVADQMRYFALRDHYGWLGVLRSSVYFLPGLRWVAPRYQEVAADKASARPYCSQAVSHAIRKHAGFSLLAGRPDRHMLPGDVVTSPLLLYLFTLAPAAEKPKPLALYYGVNA